MEIIEIKRWAIAIRPNSPGDIFRLIHGVDTRFAEEDCGILCSPATLNRVADIFPEDGESIFIDDYEVNVIRYGNRIWIPLDGLKTSEEVSEFYIWDIVDCWNEQFKDAEFCCGADEIWTSFSDRNNNRSGEKHHSLKDRMKCVDRVGDNALFTSTTLFGDKFRVREWGTPLKLCIVLRMPVGDSWRNSPDYHFDIDFFNSLGFETRWAGLRRLKDYPKNIRHRALPYTDSGICEQMKAAQEFDLVLGVNSSALDVFSAAGCLTIREAVFQGIPKSGWHGGWYYNRFLGIAPNIELRVNSDSYRNKTTEWWDQKKLETCLKLVQETVRSPQMKFSGNEPLHLGIDFEADVSAILSSWFKEISE